MKTAISIILSLTLAALAVAGTIYGINGAEHIVKFYIWAFVLPISLTFFSNRLIDELVNSGNIPSEISYWVGSASEIAVLVLLVWHGSLLTGGAVLFILFAASVARAKMKKIASS